MKNDRMVWFGRHEGWLRFLAHGVKDGDPECIRKAARLFDLMLLDRCVVVPMPGHGGRATRMLDVANEMAAHYDGRTVADVLTCDPHPSNYWQKQVGMYPIPVKMKVDMEALAGFRAGEVFVIDNVMASGVTARAALEALPLARVCALTWSPLR